MLFEKISKKSAAGDSEFTKLTHFYEHLNHQYTGRRLQLRFLTKNRLLFLACFDDQIAALYKNSPLLNY